MRRSLAIVISVLAALYLAGPSAAATNPPAGWVDRVYADFRNQHAFGEVQVDRINADTSRVTFALANLAPDHRYRLIFSSDPCSTPLAQADRLAQKWVRADDRGAVFRTQIVGTDEGIWRIARTARLMEEEGTFYFCRAASRLHMVANTDNADAGLARFRGDIRGLGFLRVDTSSMGLMTSLDGLGPNVRYRVVHSPLSCAEFLEGDPDQPVVLDRFRGNAVSIGASRTETVGKDESLTVGSLRIVRASNGMVAGCANLHAFSVWVTAG